MKPARRVCVAIPAMNELDFIIPTLECIRKQTFSNYHVFVCINQPEKYRYSVAYEDILENNRKTIELLKNESSIPVTVIDRSSPGLGWDEKRYGVGWARKLLFDTILEQADDQDILVSMDADTVFGVNYFESIVSQFDAFPAAMALSNPYYHPLSGNDELDRLMIRYEVYMRCFFLNLFRIHSPYCFTVLGSAIAFPASSYRKIRGLAPKFSGEDFYLLQKLRKAGRILNYNVEAVYPATRYSERVFFGTGPALIKGKSGDWTSYPIYSPSLFDQLKSMFDLFPLLFKSNIETPCDDFIRSSMNIEPSELWNQLRNNYNDPVKFVHACHVKFDGLRILQCLRYYHFKQETDHDASAAVHDFISKFFYEEACQNLVDTYPDFSKGSIESLSGLRDFLFKLEMTARSEENEVNLQYPIQKYPQRWKYLGS